MKSSLTTPERKVVKKLSIVLRKREPEMPIYIPDIASRGDKVEKSLPIDAHDASIGHIYVNDIFVHSMRVEKKWCVDPLYMRKQTDINHKMRAILVDWLVEVHLKFRLVPETMYLTMSLIDRYLERKVIKRTELQLVGITAMWLACKYEEYYDNIEDMTYITDNACSKADILAMEKDMLRMLEYNLTVPTAYQFLCRLIKATPGDTTTMMMSSYLMERTLQEVSMLKYSPSKIASAALFIANGKMGRPNWPRVLQEYTEYKEEDLKECVDDMKALLVVNTTLKTVYRKYSTSKFNRVVYLLEENL